MPIAVDWRPPLDGYAELLRTQDGIDIDAANAEAVRRIFAGRPMLVGMGIARDVIPGFAPTGRARMLITHSGPPITWERMCGPTRGAIMGASDLRRAGRDAGGGQRVGRVGRDRVRAVPPLRAPSVRWPASSALRCRCSSSATRRPVIVAYATQNEGLGKVLRYGAYGPEVIRRLKWMEQTLYPALEGGAGAQRADRPAQHDRPGAAHGRRVPQPQQGGDIAFHPHHCAGAGRGGSGRRRPSPRCCASSMATTTSS